MLAATYIPGECAPLRSTSQDRREPVMFSDAPCLFSPLKNILCIFFAFLLCHLCITRHCFMYYYCFHVPLVLLHI